MAKVTNADIIAVGFTKEIYRKTSDDDFEDFIDDIITEQAAILEGRVGSSVYASTTSPTKDYVKRAEKALVCAEMIQIRINMILANITGVGQEIDVRSEGAQKKTYADEADRLILRVAGDDYSGECLESDHFESESETDISVTLI